MQIRFCEANNGGTIVVSDHGNYLLQRDISLAVNFQRVLEIKQKFSLSDLKTAEYVKRLDGIAIKHLIAKSVDSGGDVALANWFKDEAALGSLAAISKVIEKDKFHELVRYAGGVLDRINKARLKRGKVEEGELLDSGFDVQHLPSGLYLGGTKFIESWFKTAALIQCAIEKTEKGLRRRNRQPVSLNKDERPSRVLYGRELPTLYKRITGNPFVYMRTNTDAGMTANLQHAFVALAALTIGADNLSAFQIQKHWNDCNPQSKLGRPQK